MAYENTAILTRETSIGYVKINRPEKLNALNRRTMEDLFDCFHALQNDKEIRVVILTGNGEKAFAAGADIKRIGSGNPGRRKGNFQFGQRVLNLIRKPWQAGNRGN